MKKLLIAIITILAIIILASEPEVITLKNIILKLISLLYFYVLSKISERRK